MTKKKVLLFAVMVACIVMLFAVTTFAANEPVSYKVKVGNSVIERYTTVGVLFSVSSTNNNRIITGINNKVEGFDSNQIVEVHVPYGIAEINISVENTSVETIVFDDFCQLRVGNLKNLKGLKNIVVSGIEAQLTFANGCSPTTVEKLEFSSPRTTISFEEGAFKDTTRLKTINFGKAADSAKPSSFTFGKNCFQNTALESISFSDQFTKYTFSGEGAFSNNAKLKNVYIGTGIKSIGTKTFDYCSALSFVYAEEVTSLPESAFRVTSGTDKSQLKIYVHTHGKVTVNTKAFDGRTSKGVLLCALEPSTTSFSNCKYELHFGVQHKYEPTSSTPTCYTSYKTDCPCGRVGNAYYTLYVSGKAATTVKLVAGTNPDIPHSFTSAYRLEYPNGIENPGIVELKCGVCGTLEGSERVAAPVVEFPGYSVSETGNRAMVVGVRFNYTALKQYEEIKGEKLEYGLVMAAAAPLNGNAPITENGTPYSNSVYVHNMSSNGLYDSTLKLSNIKDTMLDSEFIMSAYIKIGKDIVYLQGNGETKMPSTLTYSQLIK